MRPGCSIPGLKDPLEKRMAIHSSIFAWRVRGQRSLVGYSPLGHKESDTTERPTLSLLSHTLHSPLWFPQCYTLPHLPHPSDILSSHQPDQTALIWKHADVSTHSYSLLEDGDGSSSLNQWVTHINYRDINQPPIRSISKREVYFHWAEKLSVSAEQFGKSWIS